MKIIAITSPKVVDEDVRIINTLLDNGVDTVHLRKPDSDIDECRKLLAELSATKRAKIVVHDYSELYFEFSLKGIHINKNVTALPEGYSGIKTRSCHSFEEVVRYKSYYDYLFLSPIFDSISKVGYKSAFTNDELLKASKDGIIDERVIALGGITPDKIPYLRELNFGGVAMLGSIYNTQGLEKLKSIK